MIGRVIDAERLLEQWFEELILLECTPILILWQPDCV
jgi:hypothetical protein